ncbi:MAG: SLC13 family permease [Planctomycetota bacterium]
MSVDLDMMITGGVVLCMLALLALSRYGADLIIMGALTALLVFGVIDASQAIQGFANPAVLTVGLLYVVACGMRETGAIQLISAKLMGNARTERSARIRLVIPVAFLSAFANNTPIVASFMPMVTSFSKRTGIPVSRLLMPLSFAAILGGLTTLIGTSTTLVVAGLLIEKRKVVSEAGLDPESIPLFGFFTVTPVGLAMAIIGCTYVALFGGALLPKSASKGEQAGDRREYTANLRVETDSPVVNRTVEAAGLRHLPGLFLARIERGDETITAVGPDQMIHANDVLVFVGALESVVDLQTRKGLVPTGLEKEQFTGYRPSQRLIEAVISAGSPLVGRTIRAAGIRSRYDAVVVAVHRHGHRIEGKIGDIKLRAGDTLLLEGGNDFAAKFRDSSEFYLVSELEDAPSPRYERALLAIGILIAFVLLVSIGLPGIFEANQAMIAAMIAAGLMIATRCCTGPQARRAVDFQVLAVIGGAFGIGAAMQSSGLAPLMAEWMVGAVEPLRAMSPMLGKLGLMAAVYLTTVLFTTFITNNAAAVLVFPIAIDAAEHAQMELLPIAVLVAMASSAEFTTPIGYQTNLMVAGPGGYRWMDYARFGGPLTIVMGIVAIGVVASGVLG